MDVTEDSFKKDVLFVQRQLHSLGCNIEKFIEHKEKDIIDFSEEDDVNDSFYQMKNMFLRYKEYKKEIFDKSKNSEKQMVFNKETSVITLNNYKNLFSYYEVYECISSSLILIMLSGMFRFLKRISNQGLFFEEWGDCDEITRFNT